MKNLNKSLSLFCLTFPLVLSFILFFFVSHISSTTLNFFHLHLIHSNSYNGTAAVCVWCRGNNRDRFYVIAGLVSSLISVCLMCLQCWVADGVATSLNALHSLSCLLVCYVLPLMTGRYGADFYVHTDTRQSVEHAPPTACNPLAPNGCRRSKTAKCSVSQPLSRV
jgi:hypothetical protein